MTEGTPTKTADYPREIGNGRYELVELLGEGGMASVWRCRDRALGVERAIKILHREVAERKSYRSRFLAEARTMARLNHPNILRVFDVGEEDGRYWFTMEVVEGGALIDILEQTGRFGPLESLDITFQILQALSVAHLEGVVHRDVKPDNILLSPDGRARLSDFGIARIRNERVDHRTRTGVAMGTVGYMAPEQRENARGVGPGADLYAVGATLYALVTGCEPPDLFASHLDPKLLEGVPPAIRDVVRSATAYRPEKRYTNSRGMGVDIAKAYDAIARGKGLGELGNTWLARFDELIVNRARKQVPGEPKLPEPLPAPLRDFLRDEPSEEISVESPVPVMNLPSSPDPTPTPLARPAADERRTAPVAASAVPTGPTEPGGTTLNKPDPTTTPTTAPVVAGAQAPSLNPALFIGGGIGVILLLALAFSVWSYAA